MLINEWLKINRLCNNLLYINDLGQNGIGDELDGY